MTHEARTQQTIYESLRDKLTGKISTLTNFTTNSFNYVWTQAVAEELRDKEVQLTVAQFAGWVDYAGGPITEEDLEALDVADTLDVEEVEEFLDDTHVDELVKLVGVTRDMGARATGDVTFTTQSSVTNIPAGTEVGTEPDSTGDFNQYETTEDVQTESGITTVTAPIQSVEVGQEYNTGAGTITYLPNPPGGVQGVTNSDPVDGGENVESNDELRERAKEAVFRSSGGGTVQGIIGYIEENTGATEVTVIEYPEGDDIRNYPHGHVVVSGGNESEVLQAIEESRPASVEHVLRRPEVVTLNVTANLDGEDIDTDLVRDRITTFLERLGLGEDLYEDRLVYRIMGSDDDINNIASFEYSVSDQAFFFDSSQNVYGMQLDDEMLDDGITSATGTLLGGAHTFTEDTDYQETDSSGDGNDDALDWSVGRSSNAATVTYTAGQEEYVVDENMIHDGITSVQNTTQGTTLTEGTDYEEADTDGDNLQNGIRFLTSQNDGDSIDVTYDAGDLPDVLVNQAVTETYTDGEQKYRIDSAMIDDGIVEVTGTSGGNSTTFVEGTDYEEWDSNGDGRPEGIDWSIGGSQPDDDTTFTVTYDAGTQFFVDYDIREGDITTSEDEKFEPGTIVVNEL